MPLAVSNSEMFTAKMGRHALNVIPEKARPNSSTCFQLNLDSSMLCSWEVD